MRITDKLRNKVKNTVENNELANKKDITIPLANLKEHLHLEAINEITEDVETRNYLKEQSIELFKIQTKNVIELGKIFSDVFAKLSKQGSLEGAYEAWLKVNECSKRTALRYRKRYEIYSKIEKEKQYLVLGLQQKYIELIYLEENKETYINLINKGATVKEIIEMLEANDLPECETIESLEQKEIINLNNYEFLSNKVFNKIESLDDKNKAKLQRYFNEIEKILNK